MNLLTKLLSFLKLSEVSISEQILDKDIQKRKNLVFKFDLLIDDLKEYTNHPLETVSILNIRSEIDNTLKEIRHLDFLIASRYYSIANDKLDVLTANALTLENVVNKKFTSADCPKISQSLFNEPFL